MMSLLVVLLHAPLVFWTLHEASLSAHLIAPTYFFLWPVAALLSAALAFFLRRQFALAWPLLGIAPCGLTAYAAVLLLFELGVAPPLDGAA